MPAWAVPAALAILATVPVMAMGRRVATEAAALRTELAALVALRAPLGSLQADVQALQAGVRQRRLAGPIDPLTP